MKTSQWFAFAVVGLSLIASANIPRPTPTAAPLSDEAVRASEPAAPQPPAGRGDDAATRALLVEQRDALVEEARRQTRVAADPAQPRP